jgi:hypothetical protein
VNLQQIPVMKKRKNVLNIPLLQVVYLPANLQILVAKLGDGLILENVFQLKFITNANEIFDNIFNFR